MLKYLKKEAHRLIYFYRVKDWWNFIIPPVMAIYMVGLLINNSIFQALNVLTDFTFFLILTIAVAAFGFLIGEWSDINDDIKAGKKNTLIGLSLYSKIFLIVLSVLIQVLSIWKLRFNDWIFWTLYFIEIICFILYSLLPFRLKRHRLAAVVLDALYSGTLFYLLAYLYVSKITTLPLVFIFFWGISKGIRNIILHLLIDKENDSKIKVKTVANSISKIKIEKFLYYIILPLESLFFILMAYSFSYIILFSFVLFCVYVIYKPCYIIPYIFKRKEKITVNAAQEINNFYETFFPTIISFSLIFKDLRYIWVVLLYFAFFPQIFKILNKAP